MSRTEIISVASPIALYMVASALAIGIAVAVVAIGSVA